MALFDIHDQAKMSFPNLGLKEQINKIEGLHSHVGADSQNLTLPHGVVADSVNVTTFEDPAPGSSEPTLVTREIRAGRNDLSNKWVTANESQIDLASAKKTMFGQTFKAKDYMEQAKGDPKKALSFMVDDMIIKGVEWVKNEYGQDISDNAVSFAVSHFWNLGTGNNWTSVKNSVKELSSENPNLGSKAFVDYTENTASGGKHLFGLFKRRVSDLNSSLSVTNKYSVIEAVKHKGRVYFNTYDNQGNLTFSWKKPAGTPMPSQPVIDLRTDAPPKRFSSQFTGPKSEAYKVYGK